MADAAFNPADWKQALAAWRAEERAERERELEERPALVGRIPAGWWQAAFADRLSRSEAAGHRCGAKQMLTIVAYDITNPKRLHAVAKHCEDFGLRVQYSVFECRLEADLFERFWGGLVSIMDPDEDRLVAYKICASCAQAIQAAGRMVSNEKVVAYVM